MAEENAPQQHSSEHRRVRQARVRGSRCRRPQGGPGGRPGGPAKRGKRSFVRKKKVCRFCVDKVGLTSITRRPKFWRRSFRSAGRFFRAA